MDARTGAVRSVQRADIEIDRGAVDELWTASNLERLARTYWRFLSRVTLGLIRVSYSQHERSVVLLGPPLRLLTFRAPEYEVEVDRGVVRWRIARGLLVARRGRGRGYLQIEVRRNRPSEGGGPGDGGGGPGEGEGGPSEGGGGASGPGRERVHVEVEVASFHPSIAHGISRWLYEVTQSRIHVIVTYAFLRSLARLDLAESRVGRLEDAGAPEAQ